MPRLPYRGTDGWMPSHFSPRPAAARWRSHWSVLGSQVEHLVGEADAPKGLLQFVDEKASADVSAADNVERIDHIVEAESGSERSYALFTDAHLSG